MKHNLPWNVTGIPPEAREVVRAAAHREGVTVGEWLTRRILAEQTPAEELPEAEEEAPPTRSRRAREEGRGQPEDGGDLFQRIDETLRHFSRRLEDSERLQREAQHAMSAAASEINAASRDQAQAFQHLTTRIDKAERQGDTSALRDAIRTLHQGLSRLADQVAKTGTDSSSQITALSANVETLTEKIAAAREESDRVAHLFEEKLAALADRVTHNEDQRIASVEDFSLRLKQIEERFEERLRETERRVENSSNLDESVTKLESRMFAAEQRLEESLGRHLAGIERTLQDISSRLERTEQRAQADGPMRETLRDLTGRVASAEKSTRESLTDIQSNLADTVKRIAAIEAAIPPAAPSVPEPSASDGPAEAELPPVAEPPFWVRHHAEPAAHTTPVTPEANVEQLPFAPLADAYLARLRRASRATAEPQDERFKRSRRQNSMPMDDTDVVPKESGRRRTMAAAAVVVLSLALGYSAVRFQASRMAADSQTPQTPGAQTDVAAQQDTNQPERPARAASPNTTQTAAEGAASTQTASATSPAPAPSTSPDANSLTLLIAQANSGDMKAATSLGLKYADGDGVTINESEAARWLTKAANAGEAVAAYRLGALYERGRGVNLDAKQAMRWYTEAAKHGNRRAMHNLAVGYEDGAGGDKNFAEAARWFKAAAELGLTDSQFNVAVLYERGLGVKQSLSEAYKWYEIAAASGDVESKGRVAALAGQLQPAERAAADKAAKGYKPQPINIAANES